MRLSGSFPPTGMAVYCSAMTLLNWIAENWFVLLQSVGRHAYARRKRWESWSSPLFFRKV